MHISIFQPQIIQELGYRDTQEDALYPKVGMATTNSRLFILCDGMGGHENGEIASQLVCDILPESINKRWDGNSFSDEALQQALLDVKNSIDEYDSDSFRKMGTTMTLLCLHRNGVTMAHIGDSRIYHIRPSEHRILYKSRDHSVAYELFMAGEIAREELDTYKRNLITRAITPGQNGLPKADVAHTTDIESGDYFLLCSDGILEQMDDMELLDLFCLDSSDEQIRKELIQKTCENKDNHSAIFFQIESIAQENSDTLAPNDEQTSNSNAMIWEYRNSNLPIPSKQESFNNSKKTRFPTKIYVRTIFSIKMVCLYIIMLIVTIIFIFTIYGQK